MDIFPFPEKRELQKQLIEDVEETINSEGGLIAHAPTGLGKTAGTLTPAIEKTSDGDGAVFFLTPRHSQHEIALETVRKINERHSLGLVSVDLIGKDHLCEASGVTAEGPKCPRHEETFEDGEPSDKAWRKVQELKNRNLSAGELKQECDEVCAYSVSLFICQEADVIVADYFHVFHPSIREMITERTDISLEDSVIIVDEAHNLPSRARSLNSYTISRNTVEDCITEAERFGFYSEQEHLERLKKEIENLSREKLTQKKNEAEIKKADLKSRIDNFHSFEELIVDLESVGEEVQREEERSYCMKLAESLEGWKGSDQGFFRGIKRTTGADTDIKINYTCLDPSITTAEPLNSARASILMSGTLKPQKMYEDLSGLEDARKREFDSPFPNENSRELLVPTLTTRYKERDESMIQKYEWYLEKSLEAVQGNSAVFFPSYELMHTIAEGLSDRSNSQILMERRSNDKEENQRLLEKFKEGGDKVLMGVSSGSFGEGVDYPGEMMKAVFIVGIPLGRPDLETEALIDYLDDKYGKGWQYAYTYPGVNTALQAAGRCIRSKEDRGVICFMDKRYGWNKYSKILGKNLEETRAPWKEIEEFQGKKE